GEDAKSFLCDEQLLRHVEDLTKVNPVTATTVLKCLELRYAAEVFYTNAGCSLVAVNPFRLVPQLYSPELMKEYHTAARLQELKPHIFVAAEETYRNVESRIPPVNQSIIVSGESGAGKTWTSRCLMRFYATVAASATIPKGSVAVERIEKRVLDSNPVMEAFGNACTLRNSNSSRFGKYIQLQLNRSQLLTSASIQTFLLEKTRVAYQAPHERNFHIFYQIAKGATQEQRLEWDLPEDLTFSWLPNSEKALEVGDFWCPCCRTSGMCILHPGIAPCLPLQILAGLLHLGNIRYLESEDESQPCGLEDFAKTAARLLQVPVEELLDTLRIRTITAGKQRQVFKKACPKAECETRRDCLAKVIYAQLFDWLVAVINESISAEPSVWDHFIGLLDVYGFESFPDNHLEQLCINYANEKLQQHFVGHFLKAQQEEYAAEGLEWSFIDYRDNQRGLDAIEGSPVSIFSLLNEECRLNRASSAGQLQARIEAALASNPCVSRDRLSKEANFIVAHFAGRVCYQLEGMVEKNKDPVPPELVLLLQLSRDPLLQELFTSQKADEDTTKPQTKPVVVTVVSKFKGSLEQLMGLLHSTTPHYIRCLKPNARCEAAVFRKDEVLRQLEACGIVEAVNISAAGFPVSRFLPFLGWTTPASAEEERDAFRSAVQDILWHVCPNTAPLNPTESTPCATPAYCAKTKVFMTNSTLELLEARRAGALSQKAFCIQCCWRRFKRRKAAKEKRSATVIQSAVRSWLARKHFQRLRKAAVVIKRAWKKWKAKMGVLAAEELDGVDGKLPSFAGATASFSQAPGESDKAWPLNAIIRLWPLGLVLASAPVRMTASQSRLALLTCLQGLPKGDFCKAGARLPRDGIASIRALPQGSVRFRCRRSPLLHAEVRPHCRSCTLSGFNQILLDARQLLSA
uniref:Unconventional myosin-XIX n=1 Tax=Varanus komodoensis TaxID=61221 RepID=A0A8D2LX03_VARKO